MFRDVLPFADESDEDPQTRGASIRLSRWVCTHRLLDEHPELGRGLDIAREHRVADLDEDGEWVTDDGGVFALREAWPSFEGCGPCWRWRWRNSHRN